MKNKKEIKIYIYEVDSHFQGVWEWWKGFNRGTLRLIDVLEATVAAVESGSQVQRRSNGGRDDGEMLDSGWFVEEGSGQAGVEDQRWE